MLWNFNGWFYPEEGRFPKCLSASVYMCVCDCVHVCVCALDCVYFALSVCLSVSKSYRFICPALEWVLLLRDIGPVFCMSQCLSVCEHVSLSVICLILLSCLFTCFFFLKDCSHVHVLNAFFSNGIYFNKKHVTFIVCCNFAVFQINRAVSCCCQSV